MATLPKLAVPKSESAPDDDDDGRGRGRSRRTDRTEDIPSIRRRGQSLGTHGLLCTCEHANRAGLLLRKQPGAKFEVTSAAAASALGTRAGQRSPDRNAHLDFASVLGGRHSLGSTADALRTEQSQRDNAEHTDTSSVDRYQAKPGRKGCNAKTS